jgi:hypothetical protein
VVPQHHQSTTEPESTTISGGILLFGVTPGAESGR